MINPYVADTEWMDRWMNVLMDVVMMYDHTIDRLNKIVGNWPNGEHIVQCNLQ